MNTKLIVRLLGYLIALSGVFVYAQEDPRMWGTEGVALRQGDHLEWYKSSAVNERDQTCITWCDARDGYWDIYAQVIASDGRRLWPDRGLLINNAEWRQEDPAVVAVEGGWVFAWIDWRYGDRYHFGDPGPHAAVFAQKVSTTGEILWTANGVEVYDLENYYIIDSSLRLTDDRAGGAMIGWREYQPDPGNNFRVQRVNSAGSLVWNEPVMVANQLLWGEAVQAVSDEEGNMFAVWYAEVDSATQNIFGAKVTPDGTLPWGEGFNGIEIQSFPGMCYEVDLCGDETTNGFYITWSVLGTNYWDRSYYAQRFDNNGVQLWGDSGVQLFDLTDRLISLEISPSFDLGTQDGFLAAGRAVTDPIYHLVAQKIDLNGNEWWGDDGIVVGEINGYNTWELPSIQTDYEGGCIALWSHSFDNTITGGQISFLKASRLDNSGNPLWGNGGVTLQCGDMDWRYQGLISYIAGSDYARAFFMDENYLGFKSISFMNGSQISETAVRILSVIQREAGKPEAVALPNARAAVVWADGRDYYNSLYYQIVDTLGTSLLEPKGRRLLPENESFSMPNTSNIRLCSDGIGGFYAAFLDGYYNYYSLCLIHASGDVSTVNDPTHAIISDSLSYDSTPFLVSDGAGGCFLSWRTYDSNYLSRVMILRLNDRCEALWPEPIELSAPGVDENLEELAETSDGCCIVVRRFSVQSDHYVSGAKINQSGEIVWSVNILDGLMYSNSISCASDQNGGMYFVWDNPNAGEATGAYLQHLDADGNERWAHNGIAVYTPNGWNPKVLFDEQHGIYVIWINAGLFAQRLDEDGTALWAPDGIQLSTDENINSSDFSVSLNREGGFFCAWNSYMEYYSNLYGIDILPDGTPASDWWTAGEGSLLAESNREVSGNEIASFGDGSSLIVWEGILYAEEEYATDQSKPNYYCITDLFMQRVAVGQVIEAADEIPGVTPLSYSLNQNYPNPFNPTTTISFSIAKAGTVSLIVYDLLGRSVTTLLNERLNSGNYQLPWDAGSLPSGMYFYRLNAGEFTAVKKTVLLK